MDEAGQGGTSPGQTGMKAAFFAAMGKDPPIPCICRRRSPAFRHKAADADAGVLPIAKPGFTGIRQRID